MFPGPFFCPASGFDIMTPQKFAIGQLVDFDTRTEPTPRTKGPYQVLRVLPADDELKPRVYRIKSEAEPFERNVSEYEIIAVDIQPLLHSLHGSSNRAG
jgi:hypothetical protein